MTHFRLVVLQSYVSKFDQVIYHLYAIMHAICICMLKNPMIQTENIWLLQIDSKWENLRWLVLARVTLKSYVTFKFWNYLTWLESKIHVTRKDSKTQTDLIVPWLNIALQLTHFIYSHRYVAIPLCRRMKFPDGKKRKPPPANPKLEEIFKRKKRLSEVKVLLYRSASPSKALTCCIWLGLKIFHPVYQQA